MAGVCGHRENRVPSACTELGLSCGRGFEATVRTECQVHYGGVGGDVVVSSFIRSVSRGGIVWFVF